MIFSNAKVRLRKGVRVRCTHNFLEDLGDEFGLMDFGSG
jgi:hypothetical protein